MASAADEDSESDDIIFVTYFKAQGKCESVQDRFSSKCERATAAGRAQPEIAYIPPFYPEDKTQNVESWLKKIEELSTFHNWDPQTTMYNAATGLRGSGVVWYQSLPTYNISWSEWKNRLKEAFLHVEDHSGGDT